jgi:hypothetical protein
MRGEETPAFFYEYKSSIMRVYHLTRPRFHILEIVFAVVCSSFIEHFVDAAVFECTLGVVLAFVI